MEEKLELDLNNRITTSIRGVALIVTISYEGKHKLDGTEEDGKKATIFFSKCKYVENWYQDITKAHFLSLCDELATHEYRSTCKRLIVVFSGHGNYDEIEFSNGEMASVNEMMDKFKPAESKNPTLGHMARIFFIDACRGGNEDLGQPYKSATGVKKQEIERPNDSNMLVAYATPKGYVSIDGQWLNCVFETLEEDPNEDLLGALINVNKKLRNYYIKGEHHQIGEVKNTLCEKIYFLKEAGLVPFDLKIEPPYLMVTKGDAAEFTATASDRDTTKFTYQWKKWGKGHLLYGSTKKLTISNITKSDGGQYYCIVTNEWGSSVKSSKVFLIFEEIKIETNSLKVVEGETAKFTVTASSSSEASIYYQWYKCIEHSLPKKVSGVYENTLKIPDIRKSDGGEYQCAVIYYYNGKDIGSDQETIGSERITDVIILTIEGDDKPVAYTLASATVGATAKTTAGVTAGVTAKVTAYQCTKQLASEGAKTVMKSAANQTAKVVAKQTVVQAAKVAVPLAIAVEGVFWGYEINNAHNKKKRGEISEKRFHDIIIEQTATSGGSGAGGIGGSLAGVAVGATVGSVVPVVGNVIGGIIGGIVGGIAGGIGGTVAGKTAGKVINHVRH